MPQKQNRANHKYSPWYHLCSEETLRTQNLITAANRCRLLSLGGKTPERLPPCRHGNLHRPFPLWASRMGVLLSIIACCNIAVFYCIFCQKSRENASPCLSHAEDICPLFPGSAAKNHTIFLLSAVRYSSFLPMMLIFCKDSFHAIAKIMKDFSQKTFLYFNIILRQFMLFKRKLLSFHNKHENIVQKYSFNPNPS